MGAVALEKVDLILQSTISFYLESVATVDCKEIGQVMGGVDYTSVSGERKILRKEIHEDTELKKWRRKVENFLL